MIDVPVTHVERQENEHMDSSLPLQGIEKFMCLDGGWSTIAHVAHLTGDRSALVNNATETVQCLLRRHSRLRTRIRVDGNRYFLDHLAYDREALSSELFFSTMELGDETWQEIVERECNRDPYSNHGTVIFPVFYFILAFNGQSDDDHSFHLLLFHNHSVSDGHSGFVLINDFLTLSTNIDQRSTFESVNTEVLPLIGSMIPRPFRALYYPILLMVKWQIGMEDYAPVEPRIPVQVIPHRACRYNPCGVQRYKNKFLFASTSTDHFSKLHRQSRLHNVKLNGPLLGCLLLAIHSCFPRDDQTQLVPFGLGVPFNMRSRLPRSPLTSSSVGCFIGVGEVTLRRSLPTRSTSFWSLARQCMTLTHDQLKPSVLPWTMSIADDIIASERHLTQMLHSFPQGRHSELAFSNVGKYPFPCHYNRGKVQLRGIHVVNSTSGYRNSSTVYVACTDQSHLDVAMAHEMQSDEMAKRFLDCYLRLIEVCADSERCRSETTLDELLQLLGGKTTDHL